MTDYDPRQFETKAPSEGTTMTLSKRAASAGLVVGLATACSGLSAALGSAVAAASPARGATAAAASPVLSSQDRSFLAAAAQANLAEISLSQQVEPRAVTASAKDLAARYVSDHTTALGGLRQLATQLQVPLPAAPSAQQDAELAQIESQTGKNLDITFAKASVLAHQQAIALFKQEVSAGSDPLVQTFASDAMPMLEMHLSLAEQAESAVGTAVGRAPSGAPADGGGGTAGIQHLWLFGLGGGLLLAGAGSLAYRRKITSSV
jgi:putative membrane protein